MIVPNVFCQELFPEKSVKIPFFHTGKFPTFGGLFYMYFLEKLQVWYYAKKKYMLNVNLLGFSNIVHN